MVGHVVFEHAVDEQGELAGGRRHGGGLVRASGQPAVERPERVIAPNEGHGREAQDLGGSVRGRLRARPEQLPPRDLVVRRQREPGGEVMLRGPAVHIDTDLGDQPERAVGAEARQCGEVDPTTLREQGGTDLERRCVVLSLALGTRFARSRQVPSRRFALGLKRVDARLDLLVTALDLLVVAVAGAAVLDHGWEATPTTATTAAGWYAHGADWEQAVDFTVVVTLRCDVQPAGSPDAESGTRVFVRGEASRRRRAKDGVPLPPATLTRRYRFLDEQIVIRPDTLDAFIKAGLVREYDPLEALVGLGTALGTKANDSRRQEALTWAFSVWRTAGAGIQEALRSARLRVPTSSGWRLATQVAFSSSWTPVGVTLENFLVEASDTSPDCRRARDALLVDFADWPASHGGTKRQWVTFLMLLGVTDGLSPVAGRVQESGEGWSWKYLVDSGEAKEALDRDWCRQASLVSFRRDITRSCGSAA